MRESSQTQLNQNRWCILKLDKKNYMFRPEVAIIRFFSFSKYLRVKLIYAALGCADKEISVTTTPVGSYSFSNKGNI
jgi:hypothetical protein